jgi:hypothetical protein
VRSAAGNGKMAVQRNARHGIMTTTEEEAKANNMNSNRKNAKRNAL